MDEEGSRYPDPHPDLLALSHAKGCRNPGCTEVIGVSLFDDYSVRGVPGYCQGCYRRLTGLAP